MNWDDLTASATLLWVVTAVVMGLIELIAPGIFAVFFAIAALVVAVTMLVVPELPLALQLIAFAVWSAIAVLIGRRWYREYPVASADPLLNDRAARLIGQTVTVTTALEAGRGRVRVGDGEWPAQGPDAATGTRMRVVACTAGLLVVEPLEE